jgi:hypothetical protein
MVQNDIISIIEIIKRYFPKDSNEISDALDLLNLALDGLLNSTNRIISEFHMKKEYDKAAELLEFSKSVSGIQKKINEYSALISIDSGLDEERLEDELDEIEEQKTIPNYSDYVVDSSIPHTLYEDFTYKKVVAFSLNNKRYEVKDWKDLLLQTCNLLVEIDETKFNEFIDDPVMKGRKVSYFSRKYIERKNEKIKKIDIYVWTNLSANSIRNLIRKLLRKFDIKLTDYYVYLRADYTPLHKHDKANDEHNPDQNDTHDEMKIGKFVRHALRELSNNQYRFADKEISEMLSKQWSKEVLGIDFPLLKKYKDNEDISAQIKDGNYNRFWKEIFEFNGMKFLVTSQWYEWNREPFIQWITRLRHKK